MGGAGGRDRGGAGGESDRRGESGGVVDHGGRSDGGETEGVVVVPCWGVVDDGGDFTRTTA